MTDEKEPQCSHCKAELGGCSQVDIQVLDGDDRFTRTYYWDGCKVKLSGEDVEPYPKDRSLFNTGEPIQIHITNRSEWIKCSERLPESHNKTNYLVFTNHPFAANSAQVAGYRRFLDGCHWKFITRTQIKQKLVVSHWMPLPAPPEE